MPLLPGLENDIIHGRGELMRDIPVFNTENGVASLILEQIPYQQAAYIRIQSSLEPKLLVEECAQFCRACGAERIYAAGADLQAFWPVYTVLWQMRCPKDALEDTSAALFPVQEHTLETWREIYNRKVICVPNGAWMTQKMGKEMLQKGDGYFVHRDRQLLGIGRVSADTIDWVASVSPGAGAEVVKALAHGATEPVLQLTVASTNEKAVRLYESLGFLKSRELTKWYQIL